MTKLSQNVSCFFRPNIITIMNSNIDFQPISKFTALKYAACGGWKKRELKIIHPACLLPDGKSTLLKSVHS